MIDAGVTTATTTQPAPAKATGGFPPFDTTTFTAQIFWLVITMAVLFVVLWRFAGPRIKDTITERRDRINKEIEAAQENRRKAHQATVAYETPLLEARERARTLNAEYHDRAAAELKKAEAAADEAAEKATADAEARLAKIRDEAKGHIVAAAQGATIDIVSRLTGETIGADEAAAAVAATQKT